MLHERRQFGVRGFGYMSLGISVPNFPMSQIMLGHLGGIIWEIGKWIG